MAAAQNPNLNILKKTPFFTMKTHFPLLLFLTFFLLIHSSSSQTISPDDAAVMLDLNKSLNPRTIWRNPDVCKWEQVTCTGGRVVKIQLKNLGLTGSLPFNLNKLTALEDFELQGNKIGGELPTLSGLDRLKTLILTGNIFSSIPSDFFTGMSSLQGVYLDQIPFKHWEIPESLVDASNLRTLSMNNASIKGNIPVFLNGSNFLGLTDLHLSFNLLEGGLPSSFAGFTSVQSLWLNGQQGTSKLSGPIDVLQNMTGLREVWLQTNQFSGPLPSDFSGLTGLSYFSVRDNQFTGPVPESLTKLEGLNVVNLTNNLLQGPTPVFVSKSVKVDMIASSNRFCLDVPGKACDSRVDILLSCASSWGYPAPFAQDWKGNDPCNSWGGINCNNNGSIRSVVLERRNITGTISPSFAKLTSLEVLDLANNSLHGPIPKEIVDMPSIKEINLRNNQLTGGIPGTGDNPKKVKVDGNPGINKPAITPTPPGKVPPPGSPSHETPGTPGNGGNERKRVSPGVIVAIVIGSIAVVVLFSLLVLWFYKKKKHFTRVQSPNAMVVHPRHSGSDPEMVKITVAGSNMNVGAASETYSHTSSGTGDVQLVESGNMVISIQVLRNVTDNFSEDNILGRGGFGTVYKGELHDGTKIAVKRMESGVITGKGLTEFKSEIAVLTKVRHRHLVALLGYCLDGNERLLVYEYMPQGTLSQHLFNWKAEDLKPLEWTRRLTIALDVARGVEYLHGLAHQSFIHRDLKPSNILLGDDMRAKVADFGLVRLAPDGKASIETRLAGTFGYLAPEYAVTGRVTTKVDVYSFGVILMELITGRKALDERENEDSMHLVSWFRRMHINKETFQKAIDPVIELTEETLASVSTVAELAGHCSAREPYQRPDMGHAVNVLSSLVELWKPTEADSEDIYGIDLDMTLPQALKKWQAFEGSSRMDGDTSSFLASVDNTQTSIPTRPSGFADTFSSGDGR